MRLPSWRRWLAGAAALAGALAPLAGSPYHHATTGPASSLVPGSSSAPGLPTAVAPDDTPPMIRWRGC